MGILDRLAKSTLEACNGRIIITPGCWVFEVPSDYTSRDAIRESKDAMGKPMFLIGKKGVFCSNPEMYGYPKSATSEDIYFVPWADCHKCQYYRKGGTDGLGYPHCDWVHQRRGGNIGAAREVLGIMEEAKKFADSFLGPGQNQGKR